MSKKKKVQYKADGGDIASIGMSTAAGFATAGPIGAGVSLGMGVLNTILKDKKEKEQQQQIEKQMTRQSLAEAGKAYIQNMKDGGKIKGKGTAKSDSVKTKMNPGDFVVPAENADKAMELGEKYLGWDKNETAKHEEGSEPVNASNGEVKFTKEEADYLRKVGVDVDALAPKAEEQNDTDTPAKESMENEDNEQNENDSPDKEKKEGEGQNKAGGGVVDALKTAGQFASDNSGEIAGVAQTIAGLIGSKKASDAYKNIQDVKDPSSTYNTQATVLERQANNAASAIYNEGQAAGNKLVTSYMKLAREKGGANAGAILSGASSVADNAGKVYLDAKSRAEQTRMKGAEEAASLRTKGADASTRVQEVNNARKVDAAKMESQGANALINAGISNVVGAKNYKDFNKQQKSLEDYYKDARHTTPMGSADANSSTGVKSASLLDPQTGLPTTTDTPNLTNDPANTLEGYYKKYVQKKKKGGQVKKMRKVKTTL